MFEAFPKKRGVLILTGLFVLVFVIKDVQGLLWSDLSLIDFRSFYFASQAMHRGADIYDAEILKRLADDAGINRHVFPYLYPPVLAFYGALVSPWRYQGAQQIWIVSTVLFYFAIFILSAMNAATLVTH